MGWEAFEKAPAISKKSPPAPPPTAVQLALIKAILTVFSEHHGGRDRSHCLLLIKNTQASRPTGGRGSPLSLESLRKQVDFLPRYDDVLSSPEIGQLLINWPV